MESTSAPKADPKDQRYAHKRFLTTIAFRDPARKDVSDILKAATGNDIVSFESVRLFPPAIDPTDPYSFQIDR